jgi:N-carbamoylputrescine amidase
MKFGVVQSKNEPGIEKVSSNRKQNGRMIEDLFKSGADMIVLPECANHQYSMRNREEVLSFSEAISGESVSYWSEIASAYGGYIAGGILEREGDRIYNTAVLVGPNGYIGHYRKIHLFNWEKKHLSSGNLGFPVFSLKEVDVKVGMLICYDLRFPEAVRSLVLAGCDVLLVPTTWTSIGKSILWDENGYCLANYSAIAHTYSNKIAVVCADRVGYERDVRYLGSSLIIDPSSYVAAGPASQDDADILIADIDLKKSRNKRVGSENDLLDDRRPEYY